MTFVPEQPNISPPEPTKWVDMDWADYLRDQAAKYRQLAETAEDLSVRQELLDLAAICEETANNIEDRMPGG